jgi:formylglycine-generating enzyme required for sulfatase activity
MILVTGKVITTVEETIASQWLLIRPTPVSALVYIDNQFVSTGEYQAKLKAGSYNYRVEAPLYHSDAGKFEITNSKKELLINLLPAFGYVQVNTSPEQGAKIIIDNKEQSGITPTKSEALASGEHTVRVIKEMYQPTTQKVTVTDGQTTPVNFTLQPNFAQVSIASAAGANIFINGEQKGTSTWNGRLNAGVYSLEARLDKYRPAKQDIELMAGDNKKLDLQPTPIYGSVDIITKPSGATITINNKDYGTTPNTIEKLLIGNYTLKLASQGYATITKTITIDDGKATAINETLANGRPVIINSTPIGASLYIDGNTSGTTPYSGSLTFGNHTLRIENEGKKAEKTVSISQTGGETSFTLSFGPPPITETVNGVSFDMVAVKGGTFSMGSENAKPIHNVTLSDFKIGKTEVTQALWQAVMGNNPSNFKGDKLPVEQVNWNDIQDFLQKLNKITGKTYRLPTEAQWEYAARGGVFISSTTYSGSNKIADVAWYNVNSNAKTHSVASKQPNELGIYDMTGNVWEWCSDWYDNYSKSQESNPAGSLSGTLRVIRGGSWGDGDMYCRSSFRYNFNPNYKNSIIGFRVVFVP